MKISKSKFLKYISISVSAGILFTAVSCASTPATITDDDSSQNSENATLEKSENAKKIHTTHSDDEVSVVNEEETVIKTPQKEFLDYLKDINLTITQQPDETSVNKEFSSPYVVFAEYKNEPATSFKINVKYPQSKSEGKISYAEEVFNTDENGFLTFSSPTPLFSANSEITFSPYPEFDDEEIKTLAEEKKVSAQYKVKADIAQRNLLLFIWDYNEKGNPLTNNYEIQSELRKRGIIFCGNAPVNEKSDLQKSLKTLYEENSEIVDDHRGYLVVGSIKYSVPVTKLEDDSGYTCTMNAKIQAVSMKDGSKVFDEEFENQATGTNWNNTTSKCKTELAAKIAEALIYGL